MGFTFRVEECNKIETLILSANIDEMADFSKIKLSSSKNLAIDLGGITLLNSVGLRSWVQWIKSLNKDNIFVRNCPSIAVNQINILKGFIPLQTVFESIQVPFYCDHCGNYSVYLAHRNKDYMEATADSPEIIKMALTKKCENCGETCEADIIPDKYFKFLERRR